MGRLAVRSAAGSHGGGSSLFPNRSGCRSHSALSGAFLMKTKMGKPMKMSSSHPSQTVSAHPLVYSLGSRHVWKRSMTAKRTMTTIHPPRSTPVMASPFVVNGVRRDAITSAMAAGRAPLEPPPGRASPAHGVRIGQVKRTAPGPRARRQCNEFRYLRPRLRRARPRWNAGSRRLFGAGGPPWASRSPARCARFRPFGAPLVSARVHSSPLLSHSCPLAGQSPNMGSRSLERSRSACSTAALSVSPARSSSAVAILKRTAGGVSSPSSNSESTSRARSASSSS